MTVCRFDSRALVRSVQLVDLLVPRLLSFDHSLQRRSAATHLALMRALLVLIAVPLIQIDLQLLNRAVDPAKRHLVKLLQDRFVKAFANTVGLRVNRPGFRGGWLV